MYHFLIYTVLVIVAVSCSDVKDEGTDRGARSERGALWFGPRLGKRSLTVAAEENRALRRLLEAADDFYSDPSYEIQADRPRPIGNRIIFTPKLGRSLNVDQDGYSHDQFRFNPRLGRRMAMDTSSTPAEQEYYNAEPDLVRSRTRLFSPRLGRTVFSPRLGREINYEAYPDNVRVARSTNKKNLN